MDAGWRFDRDEFWLCLRRNHRAVARGHEGTRRSGHERRGLSARDRQSGLVYAVLGLAPLVGTSVFGLGVGATAVVLMILPGAYLMHVAGKA